MLIGSGYTLEEVDTAAKYVIPDDQTAAIEWNTVTNKSFSNILKKWNVTVTKSDASTGTAQGDGSLAGAEYGVYKGDQLIDTYTTDANGQFTTGYYVCGDDWTIREITASEGYLPDNTAYHVGAEAKNYTVELNSTTLSVLETVKKGSIAIIKHTDNGDTQIDTFYTNDEGFLVTPESLEYGTGYALVEVKAPYGYVINSEPVYFDVTQDNSTEDGGVTIVEVTKANTAQKGTISIYKTGEVFASAVVAEGVYQPVYTEQGLPGAVYEITAAEDIYTLDGTLRYAADEVVDTITTDETGYATSKALYLGKFNIQEITAPEGMVIKADVLRREYQLGPCQLKLCTGGFGASPHSRGSACFCIDFRNGSSSRFERRDILGTIDRNDLPQWAKEQLAFIEQLRRQENRREDR